MSSREKLRPEHLTRPALVYVRQSTPDQVRHHQESRRRQYDLAAHARPRGPPLQSAKLVDERPNNLEDASLNRLRCGVRSGYRGRHAPSLIAL
jgi:hypothetical protein